jgi:putative transposase
MLLSYRYRLRPTKDQPRVLEEQLRVCRWTYNTLLGHCLGERRAGRGTPTSITLNYLLPELRERNPELGLIHSQVLQNVSSRIRLGFENCWARRRLGLRAHLPRFRGAEKFNSMTYPQSGFLLSDGWLRLSKVGELRMIQHRPVEGRVKTLTISRDASGKWYAVFSCEVESKPILGRLPAVGVDFGLMSLVALSDGTTIEAPQHYRKSIERLRRLGRRHSRCRKGSKNGEKARIRSATVSTRVANQRRDFSFKVATGIVNKYERIYIEDLKITNLVRNRHLSKSIGDAGWGLLKGNLIYMAERSLGVTVPVDPTYTSQMCSGCGATVKKDLSVRVHRCPSCGLILDRNVNAARNILLRGIGLGQPESKLVGEGAYTRFCESGRVASMNQEATLLVGW